ncbi:hypothetical protein D9M68_861530 [compost metagenome]
MSLKDQIQAAEHKLTEAIASQEIQNVIALYTEDACFLPDGAPTLTGKAQIGAFFESLFMSGIVGGRFTTVDVDGDDHAATEIGAYELYVQAPDGSRMTAAAGRYLVTWKRIDGQWRLHRDVVSRDRISD